MKLRLLIILQILVITVLGQNPLNYLASTKGGSCYEVCYHNNYLYAGCANTLMVFPTNGVNNTPGTATDSIRFISNIDYMAVRNNFLYICANHDGLWKYDLSNPAQPAFVAHYVPANINESVYDITFYGDSIFVAAKTKVNLLKDNGNSFSFIRTVATFTGTTTRVRGVDSKDTLLAFTVGYSSGNTQDGIYIYGLKGLQQLSFYNDTQGDPQDVYFGQNTNLLHVMGGTISASIFNGQYYALDYTTPSNPTLVYNQTINGQILLGSISMPMNCTIINDTLYISTQGGGPIGYSGGPWWGQIYVYDATTPAISLLTDIYAGLYHFDCDINPANRTMYIASEWYGVLTMDVSNIYSEVFRKKTITGGWSHGSAQAKNKLVEASEGFGMRLFDVSNMQNPILTAQDTAVGFCRGISLNDSATYAYGWYLTGKRLRVRDANNNLTFVADTTVDPGTLIISDFEKSRYHNGKVAVIELINNSNKKIVLADVSNPAQPFVQFYRQKNNVNDLLFHPVSGHLFACANDSILVFNTTTMSVVTFAVPPLGALQPYKAFTLSNDTLYVFYEGVGEGIAKYLFNQSTPSLTYLSASTYTLATSTRVFLTNDASLLYITSSHDSLKAITKTAPHTVVGKYNHGADFIFDNLWGNTELYFNNGYLFLNEYMGQTSIFGPANSSGMIKVSTEKNRLNVYPNPATSFVTIQTGTSEECLVKIYDIHGKLFYLADVHAERLTLSTDNFHRGLYFISVSYAGKETATKLLIEK